MELPKHIVLSLISLLLCLCNLSYCEGFFEDADKSNDFQSQTNQHYDLRHTIPGEPDVDYPIYSTVPVTSFSCSQKHEGYYADVESRCQAFRICTHTSHNSAGFGFLCPNGTLFSQRHFVCDWYRNVRCEESERFYDKNVQNQVGSSYQMMETVRQMIEYPMKTISKALQPPKKTANVQNLNAQLTKAPQNNFKSITNAPKTPTAYQRPINSTPASKTFNYGSKTADKTLRGEDVKSLPLNKNAADVYVNSLGELSTDPGVKFDPASARIIAKASSSARKLNFAESINFGLNDYKDSSANNQKNARDIKGESLLRSNINQLKHEITAELDPKISGYQEQSPQKARANFQFLSRGFSGKSSKASSYQFQPSKQTSSNTRKTPNDISQETHNINHETTTTNDEEHIHFTFMPSTTTNSPLSTIDSFKINSELLDLFEIETTEAPASDTTTTLKQEEATTTTTELPITTTESVNLIEELGKLQEIAANNVDEEEAIINFQHNYETTTTTPIAAVDEAIIKFKHNYETTTPIATTTTTTTTIPMQTSTEMVTEVSVIESRVRSSQRRFNTQRNRTTSTTTTTIRPKIRRAHLRRTLPHTTTTTSTEATTTISNNFNRQRQRGLRRRTTTTTETPTHINLPIEEFANVEKRKINVRNIDKSTGNVANEVKSDKTTTTTTRYDQRRRLNNDRSRRVYQRRTEAAMRANTTTTSTTTSTTTPATTTTTTIKPLTSSTTETIVEEIIAQHLPVIPLNVSIINAIDSATTSIYTPHFILDNDTNYNTDNTEILLPFNDLTRAIVDKSILQNYRSNQQFNANAPKQQQQHIAQAKNKVSDAPRVYIARAEGQRIPTASIKQTPSILQQQQQQQRTQISQATPYVPLNDFLSNKFSQIDSKNSYFTTNIKNNKQQKPQQNYYTQQQQQQQNLYFNPTTTIQKQNAYVPLYQQQQQQQLPIFNRNFGQLPDNNVYQQQFKPQLPQLARNNGFQNVQLPTLTAGAIPAAYTQVAQRRSDKFNFELETTPATSKSKGFFSGASSYDVPLSSVGRLPNDITQRLRRAKI